MQVGLLREAVPHLRIACRQIRCGHVVPWPFRRFHRLVFSNVTNALCVGGSQGLCDEAATDRLSSARVESHIPWAAPGKAMMAMPTIRSFSGRKPVRGAKERRAGAFRDKGTATMPTKMDVCGGFVEIP